MAIIVLSVPHTGTRFLCSFLDSVGVIYRQYHSEPQNLMELGWETKNKAVIPVRDPLLCFTSTLARHNASDVDFVLREVLANFEILINLESQFDFEYLHIMTPDFQKIHTFVNAPLPLPEETPKPIGMIADTPSNYKTWDILSKQIGVKKTVEALEKLADVRAHYGY